MCRIGITFCSDRSLLRHVYDVLQEMGLLEDGARVYKLIGPVLVKQDPEEASQNVAKRLDYIKGELYVCIEN